MSLKDWMKKVEAAQLNEAAQTIMVPSTQPGSSSPGKPVALTVDTAKPGGPVAAAALGIKPGQSSAMAGQNSPVKAVVAPGAEATTQPGTQTTQPAGAQNAPAGNQQGNQAGLKEEGGESANRPSGPASKKNDALDDILRNHPHEHKMCQEGWGMDNSLFEALADHYFKEGRIPRSVWHGSAEELREFVESCYAKDTMGTNEDSINSGMLDEEGVAEGSLNEFAPNGFNGGDDDEGFSPEIAKMAQDDGFTKGVSLADGATLERAITINHWHNQHGGMYKQYFVKGFKAGRMEKIRHDNKQYNLNLKLMKDGSIRHGEQGVKEGFSDVVKGIKRKVAGKESPKEVEHTYARMARSAINHKTPDQADRAIDRFVRVSKVVSPDAFPPNYKAPKRRTNGEAQSQGVAEGSKEDFTMNARQADPRLNKYATDPKRSFLDKTGSAVGGALKKAGSTVMNKLHPSDDQLRSGPLEETSELERMLRQSTKENEMFESKFTKLSKKLDKQPGITDPDALAASIGRKKLGQAEMTRRSKAARNEGLEESTGIASSFAEAVEKTKTGIKHKADAGGYGRKDDEEDTDEDGKKIKKVKKDEPKKGRGRPKKTDNASGEDKKFDFSALSKTSGSKSPKTDKWDKKKTTTHKIATKADREEIDEGETIEKKGGRIHKGSYGTSHEAGDEGVKKAVTQRGRGRPKKDADDSGEVKNYDWSAFGAKKGVKLPAWDKKKTTTHKIATKADREEVDEAKLKGKQSKLDINKNGKLDGGDFALLRGQKKKDPQMESWDRQLKGLLTEGLTVSTSVGNEGGNDTVSITASDADAHKLLQILQNAGMGSGVPSGVISSPAIPVKTATSPATASTGGSAADDSVEGPAGNVTSMPMPRGMAFSVQPDETEVPTEPEEFGVADSEEVFDTLGKEHGASEKVDNGDDALSFLKKAIGHGTEYADGKQEVTTDNTPTPTSSKAPEAEVNIKQVGSSEEEVEESDEDGKKPDEDGDGVPDWADKKSGKDDNAEDDSEDSEDESEEDDSEDKEKVEEGKQECNECGGVMEDDHECGGQLNEWANSPAGMSEDEQFESDLDFMTKVISGGLNNQKVDQTVMPHTRVKMTESTMTSQLRKLAGI